MTILTLLARQRANYHDSPVLIAKVKGTCFFLIRTKFYEWLCRNYDIILLEQKKEKKTFILNVTLRLNFLIPLNETLIFRNATFLTGLKVTWSRKKSCFKMQSLG